VQCLSRLLEIPSHGGAVKIEALGDLCDRLPRLAERHRLFRQLRAKPAMNPPQWEWCEDWRWTEM